MQVASWVRACVQWDNDSVPMRRLAGGIDSQELVLLLLLALLSPFGTISRVACTDEFRQNSTFQNGVAVTQTQKSIQSQCKEVDRPDIGNVILFVHGGSSSTQNGVRVDNKYSYRFLLYIFCVNHVHILARFRLAVFSVSSVICNEKQSSWIGFGRMV